MQYYSTSAGNVYDDLVWYFPMKILDERRLDMIRGIPALSALRQAMVVCVRGLQLGAQNSQQSTAAKSGVEKSFWTIGIYTGRRVGPGSCTPSLSQIRT